MARIRTIKPEFWVSEQVADCSLSARLTFIGLWNFADDNGVHPAKPRTLKAELFPLDEVSVVQIEQWIAELVRVGLVAEFTHNGATFWHVTGWAKHQKIDRPSVKYPSPTVQDLQRTAREHGESSANTRGELDESSTSTRRALAEDSSNTRRVRPPGVEEKELESTGEEQGASPKTCPPLASSDKGTRLPEDWGLTDALRDYCRTNRPHLDPEAVAEKFKDYWRSKPGKEGRKTDWAATWRNWVRNERETPAAFRAKPGLLPADDTFEGDD